MTVPAPLTTTVEQSTISDGQTSSKKSSVLNFVKRRLWLLIAVPYAIGILWTCAHPVVSIVTGELKCRGWFIDENSLDAGNFRYNANFLAPGSKQNGGRRISSLCEALDKQDMDNMDCQRLSSDTFEVAKLVPISNAITPVSEAIAIVIPSSSDWFVDPYHNGMLQFMQRLATAKESPWLAKTVLLIAPTSSTNHTLAETVSSFLDAYLGTRNGSDVQSLPPSFTTAMIRNLLVLDVASAPVDEAGVQTPLNEVLLMPQGRRGVLPNMDLVFLLMTVYSRANFLDTRRYETHFLLHPHAESSRRWRQLVASQPLPSSVQSWLNELGDLALFARTLALGPYPAHAPTLERGIDSITLQIRFRGHTARLQTQFILDFVKRLEGVVRALSNLHERLHHSMTQYLMPSPRKFVSHSEYLIPNVLLLLPLVVRAVSLILWQMEGNFDFSAFQVVVGIGGVVLGIYEASHYFVDPAALTVLLVVVYGSIPAAVRFLFPTMKNKTASYQSLHFLTCLTAIYFIIPLILGHVSLAFPSALLWSLLIGMLSHRPQRGVRHTIVLPLLLLITWPPILVQQVFGYYSPYISFVHLPLHLLVSILWYTQTLSNNNKL